MYKYKNKTIVNDERVNSDSDFNLTCHFKSTRCNEFVTQRRNFNHYQDQILYIIRENGYPNIALNDHCVMDLITDNFWNAYSFRIFGSLLWLNLIF